MTPSTPFIVRRESGVDYVTLHRPGVRNALDDTVITALTQWADATVQDGMLAFLDKRASEWLKDNGS
tara:strand:+ start:906 stop:1106 length:201 start_codon:yes stop_codon:yes gene_type:complete